MNPTFDYHQARCCIKSRGEKIGEVRKEKEKKKRKENVIKLDRKWFTIVLRTFEIFLIVWVIMSNIITYMENFNCVVRILHAT